MKMNRRLEASLLKSIAAALAEQGFEPTWRSTPRNSDADAILSIRFGDSTLRYEVEAKAALSAANIAEEA